MIRIGIASLSFGAAAVHAAVIGEHFREYWVFGVFFVAAAALQLAWGVLVLVRPSSRVYALGALGSCLLAVTWAASRTVGSPIGPGAGSPEAVGLLDTVATGFEIAVAVGALILIRTRLGNRPISAVAAALSGGAAALAILVGTIAGLLAASVGSEKAEPDRIVTPGATVLRAHLIHFVLVFGSLAFMAIYAFITRPRERPEPAGSPEITPAPSVSLASAGTPLKAAR